MNSWCRLIDSLSIVLPKYLYKSSTVNIYVYDCHINHIYKYICMCIFTARTMTIQPCIITCIFTAWLHIIYCMYFHYMCPMYITCLRIPGVAPSTFSVIVDRYQPHNRRSEHVGNRWRSLLTKGNTAGVLTSDDSGTGHTLGYTLKVYCIHNQYNVYWKQY